jgi:hypothetical protein
MCVPLAIACVLHLGLHAQEPVPVTKPKPAGPRATKSLYGLAVDKDNQPLANTKVTVRPGTGAERVVVTDAGGWFSAPLHDWGDHTVAIAGGGVWKAVRVGPGDQGAYVFASRGGPIPITPLLPRDRDRVVEERTLTSEDALRNWLGQQAKAGLQLLAILPLREATSLFVFERAASVREPVVVVGLGEPNREALDTKLKDNSRRAYSGLHKVSSQAFLLVFRDE